MKKDRNIKLVYILDTGLYNGYYRNKIHGYKNSIE